MSEDRDSAAPVANKEAVILSAIGILSRRFQQRPVFASPDAVKDYLVLQGQGLQHQVFAVMFLDAQNRLIAYEQIFRGTLTQTAVYPREIVKQALAMGAGAVIHTTTIRAVAACPARSHEVLTQTLKAALALVDVRALDHVISSDAGVLSMAESGQL